MFPCKSYEHCIDFADTPKNILAALPTTPTITTTHKTLVKNTWTSKDHEGQHECLQALIQKPYSMDQPHISAGTETLKLVNCQNPFPETKKKIKSRTWVFAIAGILTKFAEILIGY